MRLTETVLPNVLRFGMRMTGRRGSHKLGRLNAALFPAGQTIRLAHGERFFLPPDPHFFGYLMGHEEHVAEAMMRAVGPGDVVLDIGANIGYFAVQFASRVGGTGRVIAYELDATNFGYLERNAALAAGEGRHIETVRAAISDTAGSVTIDHGAESTHHRVGAGDGPGERVAAVSIDDEVRRLGIERPIGLVKIDVEGHEPFVLAGMAETVERGMVRAMILEVMPGELGADVQSRLDRWSDRIETVQSWVDGRWQEILPRDLAHRTDTLVRFAIP